MKQFAVIGLGRFGLGVARYFHSMGHEVLAIDISHELIDAVQADDNVTDSLCLNASQMPALESLGLESLDGVVVAVGEKLQDSILICMNLLELGVVNLVAKASSAAHGKILTRLNVPRVVYPERDMGEKLAQSMIQSHILDGFSLDPRYAIIEITAPQFTEGKNLRELDLRAKYHVSVIAIKRGDLDATVNPNPASHLKKGDVLVVLGENEALRQFADHSVI